MQQFFEAWTKISPPEKCAYLIWHGKKDGTAFPLLLETFIHKIPDSTETFWDNVEKAMSTDKAIMWQDFQPLKTNWLISPL